MSKPSILVLDHDEDWLLRVQHALEIQGFDTTVTYSQGEATTLLLSHDFEMMIVGHHPPDINAVELLREGGSANFIMVQTGTQWPFEREFFYSLGARAVISRWQPDLAERITEMMPAAGCDVTTGELQPYCVPQVN